MKSLPLLAAFAVGGLLPVVAALPPSRPNFLFILSDDQGWPMTSVRLDPDVSASGDAYYHTPALARLAREGMRFTSGYAPAPLCTPTRRSLLCGMTPARQRGTEFPSDFSPASHLTIPRALKAADQSYFCTHYGKWGEQMGATPAEAGYDEGDGPTGNKHGGYAGMPKSGPRNRPTALLEDPKLTFSLTRRSAEFMRQRASDRRPFFLQVSYYAVHEDNQTLPSTHRRYAEKGPPPRQMSPDLAAMVEDLDTGVSRLLAELDRLGLAANTYVVFASDNGGNHRLYDGDDHSLPLLNHPLRLGKHFLYEGGIRVPFFIRGPGVAAGSVSHVPVVLYDLLPTFFDLAGGRSPLPADLDGGSLRPVLLNGGRGDVARTLPALVFHRPLYGPMSHSALRQGDFKLLVDWKTGKRELFNLAHDLGESKDLAKANPAKTAELFALLETYLANVHAESLSAATTPRKGKSAP